MKFPTKAQVQYVRSQYPAGTRVALVQMDDPQSPPVGTKGTVIGVDDTGSLVVNNPRLKSRACERSLFQEFKTLEVRC